MCLDLLHMCAARTSLSPVTEEDSWTNKAINPRFTAVVQRNIPSAAAWTGSSVRRRAARTARTGGAASGRLRRDRGAGSVEQTQPWPQKMASPPEPRGPPAQRRLAPGRLHLAAAGPSWTAPASQMSGGGRGDDVTPLESSGRSISAYYQQS